MTAKEKAIELFNKYSINYPIICKLNSRNMYKSEAKHCALIAVDEILAIGGMVGNDLSDSFYIYWQEVKAELEKI